jgi:homoserine dehydrogenase
VSKKSIGIGLMGLGVIGGQVASVLSTKAEALAEQAGCPLVLRKVKVLPQDLDRPQAQKMAKELFTTDIEEFFAEPEIDIVVEAIGGVSPALEYLTRALSGGKHAVTPNKELIAKHGAELMKLAGRQGVGLRYEASVGGGIPLISRFQYDLVANRIGGIYAIINGTTNYILTQMEREGVDFSKALAKAQELGYAEPDPENDVEGIDAAYKLAILASLAFHTEVSPDDIYREGISKLSSRDFRYAQELGFAIKLLAIAKDDDREIEARVHPVFLPEDSLLAKVDGVYNAVLVEGDLVDKVLFFGQGAGPLPTSSAVVADIVASAREIRLGVAAGSGWRLKEGRVIKPMSDVITRYYLRLNIADRPGVLAQIARVLGEHQISISSAIQKLADPVAETAEIVIITHRAQEKNMQSAISEFGKLTVVKEIGSFVRVEA